MCEKYHIKMWSVITNQNSISICIVSLNWNKYLCKVCFTLRMATYRQFIQGYESPEYSDDYEEAMIDQDIEERLKKRDKNLYGRNQEDESDSEELQHKRISISGGYTGQIKPYQVLDQRDIQMFQADIRKGELTKDQLGQKYRVSKSTVNRYIKNYKQHGYVKYKKPLAKASADELIKRLLAGNKDLMRKVGRHLDNHSARNKYPKFQQDAQKSWSGADSKQKYPFFNK